MRPFSRPALLAAAYALVVTTGLAGPAAGPAQADHTATPARVTLMGSLMLKLGCATNWDETCEATDMSSVAGTSVWELTTTVPAGSYEFKVRLNGSWTENYGAGGVGGGPNIPLALSVPAELTFSYDHDSHQVGVAPAEEQPGLQASDRALARTSLRKDLTKERFYFVMADRFENGSTANDSGGYGDEDSDRLQTGLDPADKAFYHGGDLRGIIKQLDYIQGLGTTSIWMTPSFKNKPVQGAPGKESAGYHGYWITDFTRIDPHLGTNAELKELVQKAHARGIKIFFDIITNHTADVLDYESSAYGSGTTVPYVSKADEPYRDAAGRDFEDRKFAGTNRFPDVNLDSFPYTPVYRQPSDATAKTPSWLNDPTMYHNRGTSSFTGENSEYGDFPGGDFQALDDLWTERPAVVHGMEDIYQTWVREAGVDGFRIDTVKHVNMQFWQQFGPALTGYAATLGNDDFFMFGEVYDANPEFMSRYTTTGKLQATVDFGFQAAGMEFARGGATSGLRDLYAGDDWFTDADSNAYSLPTFLGNHDMGRIGKFIADKGYTGPELQQRDELAHELMYLTRGQPVVYYGDEQGFTGDGGDQDAREDMFASKVASYNDNDLIGTDATTAQANFDRSHPLYTKIAKLSALRQANPALTDGAQVHRYSSSKAGIYAFSRIESGQNVEYVVAANNADQPKSASFDTFAARQHLVQIWPAPAEGKNARKTAAANELVSDSEGRVTVTVPARSATVYKATKPLKDDGDRPMPYFESPGAGGIVGGRAEIGVGVPGGDFNQVTVAYREVGTSPWTVLGTDDNAPYRVFQDVSGLPRGTLLEYRAVVRDHDGDLGVTSTYGMVGAPPAPGGGGGGGDAPVGPVDQPAFAGIPGSHGSEIGCPDSSTDGGSDPGDWDPACQEAQMSLSANDEIWRTTVAPRAGGYAYKVAINKAWDENYGLGGVLKGSDIGYTSAGAPITFYYDHRTHWATNSVLSEIVSAVGDFQSEMGCSSDWDPGCMRGWLQDPNDDDVYTLATTEIPPGSYQAKAVSGFSWDTSYPAANVVFTVAEGEAIRFRFDTETNQFSVTTEPAEPPTGPDLATARATWVQRSLVAWDLPDERRASWTYRLYWGAPGSLTLDDGSVEGGSSVPLRLDASAVTGIEDAEGLRVPDQHRRAVRGVWEARGAGYQVAVAAFDGRGRLVDATGVAFP